MSYFRHHAETKRNANQVKPKVTVDLIAWVSMEERDTWYSVQFMLAICTQITVEIRCEK